MQLSLLIKHISSSFAEEDVEEDVSAGTKKAPLTGNNFVIWNNFIQMFIKAVEDDEGWSSWVAGSKSLIMNKGVITFSKSWKRVFWQKAAFAAEVSPGWPDELPSAVG